VNIRLLARSFAIAMVFSILLLVTGSVGITVFALAMETEASLSPVYDVSSDNSGGFTVTASPGLFLSFVVVLALLTLLTLLISIGHTRPAARGR
jgi:uncharacterized BrkB/YihY/UPF0761 family membrane protein